MEGHVQEQRVVHGRGMEENRNIVRITNIHRNSADADIVKNKKLKHINKPLSIPLIYHDDYCRQIPSLSRIRG